jgi:hypothetical protein
MVYTEERVTTTAGTFVTRGRKCTVCYCGSSWTEMEPPPWRGNYTTNSSNTREEVVLCGTL